MGLKATCFDLNRLLALRRHVADLNPAAAPALRLVVSPGLDEVTRLGILPGSYNPPTTAHFALADFALASGRLDVVVFSLATRTVNKERVAGMSLDDRLLLLGELVDGRGDLGVALVNRGLYVEQAEIVRQAQPKLKELWFIVGFDKIVQIFDPVYYDERDRALDRLFRLAAFLVAPRGEDGVVELEALFDRAENRRYRSHVSPLAVPAYYRDVSSTRSRASGGGAIPDVPPVVEHFIEKYGVYGHVAMGQQATGIDRYRVREKLVDRAETGSLPPLEPHALDRLWRRAIAPDAAGAELRSRIYQGESLAADATAPREES